MDGMTFKCMLSSGQHVPQLSADMKRALEDLQELVEPLKIEEAQNPTTTKTIPKKLNPRLSNFACLLARESATNLAIKNHVLDQVCNFMSQHALSWLLTSSVTIFFTIFEMWNASSPKTLSEVLKP